MGKGFARKKKEAKAMQEQFAKIQDELKNMEAVGSAGNGLVTLTLNGENELINIKIKPDCVDPEDIDGLQDLIKAAHNDAHKKLLENNPMGGLGDMGGGMPDLSAFGF